MDDNKFWEIVDMDKRIVKTWPKWMQEVDLSQPHCADEDA